MNSSYQCTAHVCLKLMEEVCKMGSNPHFICHKTPSKSEQTAAAAAAVATRLVTTLNNLSTTGPAPASSGNATAASSEDEDDEEDLTNKTSEVQSAPATENTCVARLFCSTIICTCTCMTVIVYISLHSTTEKTPVMVGQRKSIPLMGYVLNYVSSAMFTYSRVQLSWC